MNCLELVGRSLLLKLALELLCMVNDTTDNIYVSELTTLEKIVSLCNWHCPWILYLHVLTINFAIFWTCNLRCTTRISLMMYM